MGFNLRSGTAMIAHPRRGERGSEDAYLIDGNLVGVADGIGSYYIKEQIDSGIFARELLNNCKTCYRNGVINLRQTILDAASLASAPGAATVILAGLEDLKNGTSLQVANVGDTGCIVIRGDQVVFETTPRMWNRSPFQIGKDTRSTELHEYEEPDVSKISLCCEDIIVFASDGLWNNLKVEEVVKICRATIEGGVELVAKVLVLLGKYSDKKLDDITVVVSLVVPENGWNFKSGFWVEECLQKKGAGRILWKALVDDGQLSQEACA